MVPGGDSRPAGSIPYQVSYANRFGSRRTGSTTFRRPSLAASPGAASLAGSPRPARSAMAAASINVSTGSGLALGRRCTGPDWRATTTDAASAATSAVRRRRSASRAIAKPVPGSSRQTGVSFVNVSGVPFQGALERFAEDVPGDDRSPGRTSGAQTGISIPGAAGRTVHRLHPALNDEARPSQIGRASFGGVRDHRIANYGFVTLTASTRAWFVTAVTGWATGVTALT